MYIICMLWSSCFQKPTTTKSNWRFYYSTITYANLVVDDDDNDIDSIILSESEMADA